MSVVYVAEKVSQPETVTVTAILLMSVMFVAVQVSLQATVIVTEISWTPSAYVVEIVQRMQIPMEYVTMWILA
jgi:hypothetical protein